MIDLNEYNNQHVLVMLRNGKNYSGTIRKAATGFFHFFSQCFGHNYYPNGLNVDSINYDILKISVIESPKEQKLTTDLNTETLRNLADALTPDAIKFIESHPEYAEVMTKLLEKFVTTNLGTNQPELPFMLLDRVKLTKCKL